MKRAGAALALALLLVAPLGAGDVREATAKPRYRYRTERIAPGLRLTRILDRRGPNRIRVLTMDPATKLTLDMALARGTLPGLQPTKEIAARKRAIAAINGSVYLPWGRPVGIFAADGDLEATPLIFGNGFAMSQDELSAYFGHPETRIEARVIQTGVIWRVHQWNEPDLESSKVGAFTPHGGSFVRAPLNSCSARLHPSSGKSWGLDDVGVARDYLVDRVRCRYERMPRRGGIVVAARRDGRWADEVGTLIEGETVRLSWDVGWRQALDITAGNPLLMEAGRNVGYTCGAAFCNRHPRTGIGLRADGKILLVTVDGRQKKRSVGMTPLEFANLFERLRASWALNLDGGGSTTMVARGEVVNRPSGGRQRPVASAILVLGHPDRGENGPSPYSPPPQPSPSPTPTSPISPPETPTPTPAETESVAALFGGLVAGPVLEAPRIPSAGRSVLTDPASTGGLLQAIASGELKGPTRLPPTLARVVRVFQGRSRASR